MPTTSLLGPRSSRALLGLGIALTPLGLGVGAWVASHLRPLPAAIPVRVAKAQATGKHSSGKVHFDVLAKLLADDRRSASAKEWLRELADPKAPFRVPTKSHSLLGHPAPDFILQDHREQFRSLRGLRARGPVVLVFYLGYGCNACVHELFEMNADLERFRRLGAEVVAVSGDSADLTRRRFEQYGLFGFPVLADPGHAVAQAYGTFRPAKASQAEELLHGTFIVGRSGQVCWASFGATPFRNHKALLYELARLKDPPPPSRSKERKTP